MNEVDASKTLDIFFNTKKAGPKWDAINRIEKHITSLKKKVYGELIEIGTPGLYSREIQLPAGTLLTSRIHKTCHQFCVLEGAITVYNVVGDTQDLFIGGHRGITLPGTRRVLYTHKFTRWVTYHPTSLIGVDFMYLDKEQQQCIFDTIMQAIIQDYDNPLITDFEEGVFI